MIGQPVGMFAFPQCSDWSMGGLRSLTFCSVRVIVSLGSSAQGQDRIPKLPETASDLFTRNRLRFGRHATGGISEDPRRGCSTHSLSRRPESESGRRRHPGETSRRRRGESDGRERSPNGFSIDQFRGLRALAPSWFLSGCPSDTTQTTVRTFTSCIPPKVADSEQTDLLTSVRNRGGFGNTASQLQYPVSRVPSLSFGGIYKREDELPGPLAAVRRQNARDRRTERLCAQPFRGRS